MGNGNSLQVEGFSEKLQVQVQGQPLEFHAYLLPISRAEIILDGAWLATLGPHLVDYNTSKLHFFLHSQFITLTGERYSNFG